MHLTVDVDMNEHDHLLMENIFASCMTTFLTDFKFEHSMTKQSILNQAWIEDIPVFLYQ